MKSVNITFIFDSSTRLLTHCNCLCQDSTPAVGQGHVYCRLYITLPSATITGHQSPSISDHLGNSPSSHHPPHHFLSPKPPPRTVSSAQFLPNQHGSTTYPLGLFCTHAPETLPPRHSVMQCNIDTHIKEGTVAAPHNASDSTPCASPKPIPKSGRPRLTEFPDMSKRGGYHGDSKLSLRKPTLGRGALSRWAG
jgi:hypothetical protein